MLTLYRKFFHESDIVCFVLFLRRCPNAKLAQREASSGSAAHFSQSISTFPLPHKRSTRLPSLQTARLLQWADDQSLVAMTGITAHLTHSG